MRVKKHRDKKLVAWVTKDLYEKLTKIARMHNQTVSGVVYAQLVDFVGEFQREDHTDILRSDTPQVKL